MPNETNAPASAPTLNWTEAEKHLKSIEDKYMEYAGKTGHNPFVYLRRDVNPLKARLENISERTAELHAAIMVLKFEVPKVYIIYA